MKKTVLFAIIFSFVTSSCLAQSAEKAIQTRIDTILAILNRVDKVQDDSVRMALAEKSAQAFQQIMINPDSWEADLSALSQKISIIKSPDGNVRIFTWAIPLHNDYYYIGFIQRYDKKAKTAFSFRLYDRSDQLKKPEKSYLNEYNWYGCVYYDIQEFKHKRKKVYVLLGADPANDIINRKIIDFLTFRSNGEPRFGYDVRNEYGEPVKRFIFEYNNQAAMLLTWNKDLKMIVFDHLSPSEPKFKGLHQFYGPDFSYDGLKFDKGKFIYKIDVDVRDKSLK